MPACMKSEYLRFQFLPLVDLDTRTELGSGKAVSFEPGSESFEFTCRQVIKLRTG